MTKDEQTTPVTELTSAKAIVEFIMSGKDADARRRAARLFLVSGEPVYSRDVHTELDLSQSKTAKLLSEWQKRGLIGARAVGKKAQLGRTEVRYYVRRSDRRVVMRAVPVLTRFFADVDRLEEH